ncbi:MAG: hypothetical protein M1829_000585 [Trizodia sp. TS-e1964]|nr:MAG: hypothetical protein M1829_000585 [Trizodia sp. TS-e1964]
MNEQDVVGLANSTLVFGARGGGRSGRYSVKVEANAPEHSVLPPQPRYPTNIAYNSTPGNGASQLLIETNNILSHPTGPEYQLLVGEGTYRLRDDLLLATPHIHPSEIPIQSQNPLATILNPPTAGTKLSLVSIPSSKPHNQLYKLQNAIGVLSSSVQSSVIKESSSEPRSSGDSDALRGGALATPYIYDQTSTPAFGEGNTSLISPSGPKRRKPKSNINKSSSSFLSRAVIHDSLSKRLQEHGGGGNYAFANINRSFQWLDLMDPLKAESLTKLLFTRAHPLCHDVNQITKSSSHLDVIIGFSSADIIWYEPFSQKYGRLNKNGVINPSPVSDIRWIPGSDNLFLAAHMDGSLVVYDKEKEDAPFVAEEIGGSSGSEKSNGDSALHVSKSVNSKNQRFNPVSCWNLSNQKINAFSFSPDSKHLAVVSEDGSLRIVDYLKEELLDLYTSYYGGFTCVCWSPDGKYALTGGQDDLVSIWSLSECRIVARCQGHHSWVSAVAFDPWSGDERNYRFGSVGEDCRLLLWDFSEGMLHRPKAASVRHRGSISSYVPRNRGESQATSRLRSNSNVTSMSADDDSVVNHPVVSRARTANLPPVMSKIVDEDPLCWLRFQEDSIITSCISGMFRIFGAD